MIYSFPTSIPFYFQPLSPVSYFLRKPYDQARLKQPNVKMIVAVPVIMLPSSLLVTLLKIGFLIRPVKANDAG